MLLTDSECYEIRIKKNEHMKLSWAKVHKKRWT